MNEFHKALEEAQQFDDVRDTIGKAFNSLVTNGDAINLALVLTESLGVIVSSMQDPTPIQLTVAAAIRLMTPEQAVLAAMTPRTETTRATVH